MSTIWYVLPAYNEAKNLRQLILEIDFIMKELPDKYRIVLVDDGSIDETYIIASRII